MFGEAALGMPMGLSAGPSVASFYAGGREAGAMSLWDDGSGVGGYDSTPTTGRRGTSRGLGGATPAHATARSSGAGASHGKSLPAARSHVGSGLGRGGHKGAGPHGPAPLAGSSLARLQSPVKLQSLSRGHTARVGFADDAPHGTHGPEASGDVHSSMHNSLAFNSRLAKLNTHSRGTVGPAGDTGLVPDSTSPWSPVVLGMEVRVDRDVVFELGTISRSARGKGGGASEGSSAEAASPEHGPSPGKGGCGRD